MNLVVVVFAIVMVAIVVVTMILIVIVKMWINSIAWYWIVGSRTVRSQTKDEVFHRLAVVFHRLVVVFLALPRVHRISAKREP